MRTLSKHLFVALLGTALLASCSRPVAYFQPTTRQQVKSVKTEVIATIPVETSPTVVEAITQPAITAMQDTAPDVQIAQTRQAISQVEAYVRNDNKMASNRKLAKRMTRLNELLTTASQKEAVTTNAASSKKMTFMERSMLRKLDKKIKNHVAPDKTNEMNSNIRLGLIVGIIGLLLLILGGGSVLGVIGLIGFIVGGVLIVLGLING